MKIYRIQCKILDDITEIENFLKENKIEFNKKVAISSPSKGNIGFLTIENILTIFFGGISTINLLYNWLSERKHQRRYLELSKKIEEIKKTIEK